MGSMQVNVCPAEPRRRRKVCVAGWWWGGRQAGRSQVARGNVVLWGPQGKRWGRYAGVCVSRQAGKVVSAKGRVGVVGHTCTNVPAGTGPRWQVGKGGVGCGNRPMCKVCVLCPKGKKIQNKNIQETQGR